MTAFTVIASNEAENQLTNLWILATDRADVTAAQHRIEQELAADPRRSGKEVAEGLWRINCPPLCVLYEIDDTNRLVRITSVGRIP
jgi:hypothetical protein